MIDGLPSFYTTFTGTNAQIFYNFHNTLFKLRQCRVALNTSNASFASSNPCQAFPTSLTLMEEDAANFLIACAGDVEERNKSVRGNFGF